MAPTVDYPCVQCGKVFDNGLRRAGHIGGKHSRTLVPIRHGTPNGYVQHVRRKVPVDDDDGCGCRAAHAQHQRERRLSRKAA